MGIPSSSLRKSNIFCRAVYIIPYQVASDGNCYFA